MFDLIFLQSNEKDRLVTNIGGITNVTYIPKSGNPDEVIAYDTGPGNMIIDGLAQQWCNKPYDSNGEMARQGKIDEDLLRVLLMHPYFAQEPPKSTGRELMQSDFVPRFGALLHAGYPINDALAVATELTARTLADAANKLPGTVELVLSGGGARNTYLVERIKSLLKQGSSVVLSHELMIDEQAKESIAFAFFAKARIDEQLIHLPNTTGAIRQILLGSVAKSA
jgi:anhydro-N-acetylmuramic acid kinase